MKNGLQWLMAFAITMSGCALGIWFVLCPYDVMTALFRMRPDLMLQRSFGFLLIFMNGAIFCMALRDFIKDRKNKPQSPE